MYAAKKGHSNIVEFLVEKGADVNAKSNNGVQYYFIHFNLFVYIIMECIIIY